MHDQQNNFVVKKKKDYDYQETPFIEVNITTFLQYLQCCYYKSK